MIEDVFKSTRKELMAQVCRMGFRLVAISAVSRGSNISRNVSET